MDASASLAARLAAIPVICNHGVEWLQWLQILHWTLCSLHSAAGTPADVSALCLRKPLPRASSSRAYRTVGRGFTRALSQNL